MKTVISASRRTDIPAFYLNWLIQVIKSGGVKVQNPVYKKMSMHVDMRAQSVEWIVLWSRNYAHFLKKHLFFSDYQLFFHFTILSHHRLLEKRNLPMAEAISQMESLIRYYGYDHIIWRYDPIVCWCENKDIFTNYKKNDFDYLCRTFSSMGIRRCYFSFVTMYSKFKRRFEKKYPRLDLLSNREKIFRNVLNEMREISDHYNIRLYSCCNDHLIGLNTYKGSCISGNILNTLNDKNRVTEAKAPTREDCGCTKSIDIGDYLKHPCYFGCMYCYANPVL